MKHAKRMISFFLPLGAALYLTGCSTMAPAYTRPAAPVPAAWPVGPAYEKSGAEKNTDKQVAGIPWREFFIDKRLGQLIELALKNNRDLKVATLNIERSRAQFQIRRSDLLPKLDANAAASFQRIPETLSSSGHAVNVEQYSVGHGISSYEVDLF
ncbi:MAG: TolC family protein, partial [Deltaproteobacteria bacterium]|nr:TolC family protein [Deltaproteobacteria bacterium]